MDWLLSLRYVPLPVRRPRAPEIDTGRDWTRNFGDVQFPPLGRGAARQTFASSSVDALLERRGRVADVLGLGLEETDKTLDRASRRVRAARLHSKRQLSSQRVADLIQHFPSICSGRTESADQ